MRFFTSNGSARSQHPLELFGLHVILLCKWSGRKSSDLDNQVRGRELIKQRPHVVATYALSVSTLPPYLTALNSPRELPINDV